MNATYQDVVDALQVLSISENVPIMQRFFKTGEGQYGAGDIFIGVKVPEQRKVAQAFYKEICLEQLKHLLQSSIHEHRLTALFILVSKYKAAKTLAQKQEVFAFYCNHKAYVNNWDLVDSSTHKIVGPYVHETKQIALLYDLANDENMWSKRIAVVAFWYLWKYDYVQDGLAIIKLNLQHPHDLMHKANGWMLRELWKIYPEKMLEFIKENYIQMPRTTLRYAIEILDVFQRQQIMQGKF